MGTHKSEAAEVPALQSAKLLAAKSKKRDGKEGAEEVTAMEESRSSRGAGSLFFAAIPFVIGLAFLIWLSFFSGCFDFRHHIKEVGRKDSLEDRMDNRVGVKEALTAPVKVIIRKGNCFFVDRAFLDGLTLTVYLKNGCSDSPYYFQWNWRATSPDGTVVHQGYSNSLDGLDPGSTVEYTEEMPNDRRIAAITVWAKNTNH